MSYAIIGFGKIGQALAHAFARKNIEVTVASRRPPEALAPQARAIGPTVIAKSLRDALEADTIILAIPFGEHRAVAQALPNWKGKTVIDVTNAFGVASVVFRRYCVDRSGRGLAAGRHAPWARGAAESASDSQRNGGNLLPRAARLGLRHYRPGWQADEDPGVYRHASTGSGLRDALTDLIHEQGHETG
ncbi:MAG: NAD(P)-binding domain-containing protein [Alphaproteobacteria bacterium]|nr:NAD(P)-binding domain-containing protein [Alphaproteobacteria bacterium]